jgi:hypothetical protein
MIREPIRRIKTTTMSSLLQPKSTANAGDYWSQTQRPLTCLVFLTPLLIAYEAGVLWLGDYEGGLRNGADFLMRDWLEQAGFHHWFLLPALVVALLLGWQIAGKYPWRVSADTLAGMAAESLLFAFVLIVLGQLQDLAFQRWGTPAALSIEFGPTAARAVTYLGAGVYEEVLFRLCLLPLVFGVLRIVRLPKRFAAVVAVVATSLLFAAAHYVGPVADQFALFSFTFRALAGLFFAGLFCLRGFGITVGCHAAYDLLVGVLLAGTG